jgi:hypothetical protein
MVESGQSIFCLPTNLEGAEGFLGNFLPRRARKSMVAVVDAMPITWELFIPELLARFRPTAYEDFDEALSRITQKDTLQEYQAEFERIANPDEGWPQKALIGTFFGGLKAECNAPNLSLQIRKQKPPVST